MREPAPSPKRADGFTVVDLFSGAGGMSYGFHKNPNFSLIGAADAQIGKPSMGQSALECNHTYKLNMGLDPVAVDLGKVEPEKLRGLLGIGTSKVNILSACAPCTGFSRANPMNHLRNDTRNSLVEKSARFATALDVDILVMENARELLSGNFREHFNGLQKHLEHNGYHVHAASHMLTRFGLPQIRERALVVAIKKRYSLHTLTDLWEGYEPSPASLTVRRAFEAIREDASCRDRYPRFSNGEVLDRLAAIPKNGGSWTDLMGHPDSDSLLTPAMKKRIAKNKLGSHPDVYGRMWWDRPAPTIKRECSHIGNGRYAHPVENRLCSLREMAMLQGFPNGFEFNGSSLSNNYRHIGDAVPPFVSHQISWVCHWILTGERPRPGQWILPDAHFKLDDLVPFQQPILKYA